MDPKPPPDAVPNGAHFAVCPNETLGSTDRRREDFWETTSASATAAREAAVAACEDLALEHGGQWGAYTLDTRGSWSLLHRFPAENPRPTATAARSRR